ncbi:NAD(+) diphosphatase [Nesterenkonia sp. HG001]|uniref:NAD(+) diphosphatase n=1 Tax=Nesterenkonia sp. HG001 TaxID=2983207 RepID=UPI002AC63D75|nr:NAD(+) diphosphatase [Nesterenkonia sp. HG001]MDZ5076285.1 NAD(+) diphosphatase [Nesterenkonia sp. HG001]
MQSAPGVLDLPLSRPRIDRRDQDRQRPDWLAQVWQSPGARVLRLDDGRAPVRDEAVASDAPVATLGRDGAPSRLARLRLDLRAPHGALPADAVYLGADGTAADGSPRHLVAVPAPGEAHDGERAPSRTGHADSGVMRRETDATEADGRPSVRWADLRRAGAHLDALEAELLTQATAVLNWHATSPFCPRCGSATEIRSSGWMRRCPACGAEHFPRTDPAVITAVVAPDDTLLLGSATRWDARMYSTFAGFVEAGESLEDAVVREVAEEAGATVERVEYIGSQAWPFPRSLMLGYLAHARDTQARADQDEIRDVRWFTRTELHEQVAGGHVGIPPRSSISRALIEHWYGDTLPDVDIWSRGVR